jgi:hypothetical protein
MDTYARSQLVTLSVQNYLYWGEMMKRLDATENDEENRKRIENAVFEMHSYETKYQRNRILQLAAVGFPDEFRRLCAGKWQREELITPPKYITKKWLEAANLRVQSLYWKQKVKDEKKMLEVMQKEHKSVIQRLKLIDEEDEE